MRRLKILTLAIVALSTASCGEYELLEHQRVCKQRADSTYRADLKQLSSVNDSLCEANSEHYYQAALDSLIPKRIAEMKKLVSR